MAQGDASYLALPPPPSPLACGRSPSDSRVFLQFSPKVQVSALNACSALLAYLSMDDSGMKFRSLVQPCLQVSWLVDPCLWIVV